MAVTLLQRVRVKLARLDWHQMQTAAAATGMSVETVQRIRRGITDPAYSKVQRLAEHLRLIRGGD
jgi:transcriptional regulator with XRE-family HTH domain